MLRIIKKVLPDAFELLVRRNRILEVIHQESPIGRRSLCYDHEALESRKQNKPIGSAVAMATAMGISLLNEDEYLLLHKYGTFDSKTSSWLESPAEIRKSGGSIFGDKRFGRVFIYHNGAESYYAGRGFRGCLRV